MQWRLLNSQVGPRHSFDDAFDTPGIFWSGHHLETQDGEVMNYDAKLHELAIWQWIWRSSTFLVCQESWGFTSPFWPGICRKEKTWYMITANFQPPQNESTLTWSKLASSVQIVEKPAFQQTFDESPGEPNIIGTDVRVWLRILQSSLPLSDFPNFSSISYSGILS